MVVTLSIAGSVMLYVVTFFLSAMALKGRTKSKLMKLALASALPFIISGYRYNVGWDYGSYVWGFQIFDSSQSIFEIISKIKFGDSLGLNVLMWITKGLNSQFLFLAITSFLCYGPAFLYLLDEWNDEKDIIVLSAFVTCFTLLMTGYSAIKQGIAMSFCLYSLKYVIRRKTNRFVVCMGLAMLFHSTAFVFIPVYFLWNYRMKMIRWVKIGAIIVTVLFVVFFEPLVERFGGERFSIYGTATLETNNYLFVLMLVWLCIYYFFSRELVELDRRNELLIVLYTVGTILMFIGYRNAFSKRIAYYFNTVEIMLLPQLSLLFTKRDRVLVSIMIGLYAIFIFALPNIGTATNMAPIPYSFLFGVLQ